MLASSDQLALLLDSTGEGIYGVDLDGRCVFINRAGAEMLGCEPAELLGRNMHETMHHTRPDGAPYPAADCPIYNAFRSGRPCRLDDDVLWRADGTRFCAEYSSYPIFDHGGIAGAVVTFVDITERRRAQELLQRAHAELERRVAERTQALTDTLAELARSHARLRELSELIAAIRKAARGGLFVSPRVAETLACAIRNDAGRASHELLSRREYQVFTLIAKGRSLTQIAGSLSLSLNTVSTYRARIMEKIDTHNDVETALYAVRHHLVSMPAI